jgi:hypothetical protein
VGLERGYSIFKNAFKVFKLTRYNIAQKLGTAINSGNI